MMMMDRVLLVALCLSGWLNFSSCLLLRQYVFVSSPKTWAQAQTHCRQKYTDLVNFENIQQLQFMSYISSAAQLTDVWIGLLCDYQDIWSDSIKGSASDWENATRNRPLFAYHFCVSISKDGFGYEPWSVRHPFICQNETQLVFVNETMDWFSAWRYCRENFTDLTTPLNNSWQGPQDGTWYSTVLSFVPSGEQAWIGLYEYPFTFWSYASSSFFRYWDDLQAPSAWLPRIYGVANFQRSKRWRLVADGVRLPFICLNISQVPNTTQATQNELRSTKVLQLRMSCPVDTNDSAVNTGILTQLQDSLLKKGVSGVKLKWRAQPDGKVFHKDKKATVTYDGC